MKIFRQSLRSRIANGALIALLPAADMAADVDTYASRFDPVPKELQGVWAPQANAPQLTKKL